MRIEILILLFKVILDFTFVDAVSPLFSYAGLTTDINYYKVAGSYIVLLALTLVLPKRYTKPSDFALIILFIFIIIPILSLWGFQDKSSTFVALATGSFGLLALAMRIRIIPNITLPDIANGKIIYLFASTLLIMFVFGELFVRGGLNNLNLNFRMIYDLRSSFKEHLGSGFWAYIYICGGKSILVVFIAWTLWHKRWKFASVAIALEVLLFAISTHKEFVFYPVMIIFVYGCDRLHLKLLDAFVVSLCGLLIGSIIIGAMTGDYLALSVFANRSFFEIGYNHYSYYSFFQHNPFVLWSNSFLSSFITYPYNQPIPLIIGYHRYSTTVSAYENAGYIASGYMQCGAIGIFLYTALVAAILKLFDWLARNRLQVGLATAVTAVSIYQLVNIDVLTSLLTGGVALNLVALWFIGSRSIPRRSSLTEMDRGLNGLFVESVQDKKVADHDR